MTDTFLNELFSAVREENLAHAYDPVKAREYYLRTRKLKGRSKKQQEEDKVKLAKLTKDAKHQISELDKRFKALQKVLAELTKQKKAIAPAKSDSKSSSSAGSSSSAKDRKPLTAAQKREAAKKAKERRDKESDPSLSAQAKELEAKIKKVQESIKQMRAQLAAAKKKANKK